MSLIEARGLAKDYRTGNNLVHALRGVDFKVEAGEFVGIMGPSGSGKTTFMNLLGLLDRPTRGTLLLEDVDVGTLSPRESARLRNQHLGFVFQTFNLLPRATALENIKLPLTYSSVLGDAVAALERVGLSDRATHRPTELSGGQQQRVAIARAIVNEPKILLCDEPTGNLDSRTGEEIMALFQVLNQSGMTIILVTHEHDIALHCQRIVTFKDGLIRSDERVRNPLKASEVLESLPVLE